MSKLAVLDMKSNGHTIGNNLLFMSYPGSLPAFRRASFVPIHCVSTIENGSENGKIK